MSRLWAAANAAHGSVDDFLTITGLDAGAALTRRLERLLAEFEHRRDRVRRVEEHWHAAFFGDTEMSTDQRLAIEQERLECRDDYNAMRFKFLLLAITRKIKPIRWNAPTPREVAEVYGGWLDQPEGRFDLPATLPEVQKSRPVQGVVGTDYWLRFPSPSARVNDHAFARVHEPVNVDNPPTLIFGHGICVEFDHWRGLVDEVEALVGLGFRVIRPEAPWHGRRVPSGYFAGERFIGTTPIGQLDHFSAAIAEWAVLLDWSRTTSTGPVAVGGSSLGSMTAHLVADRARRWPERLHPDALFMITHAGGIGDAVFRGRFSDTWNVRAEMAAAGWTEAAAVEFMTILKTEGPTVVAPQNVVSVIGKYDDVTPFDSAVALLDDWNVPPENRFVWSRGHFSVPITMMRDHAPLHRLRAVIETIDAATPMAKELHR